jgi:hypothetical protein
MMKLALIFPIIFLAGSPILAFDFAPYSNSGPTLSGEINYFIQRFGSDEKMLGFANWETDSTHRERLMQQAWGMANRSSPVDNRPYLYALALDLYNTLPPGATYIEGNLDGGKTYWSLMYIERFVRSSEEDYKGDWRAIELGHSRRTVEQLYIRQYLREHAEVDLYDAPPSLDPRHLNLQTPTHYAALTRWMAETVTARAEGVPPWEAAAWNAANRHRWESASAVSDAAPLPVTTEASTAPAVTPPAPAQELASPTGDAVTAAPAPSRGWLPAWLLGIAGVVVALLLWRRLRR